MAPDISQSSSGLPAEGSQAGFDFRLKDTKRIKSTDFSVCSSRQRPFSRRIVANSVSAIAERTSLAVATRPQVKRFLANRPAGTEKKQLT
jgi:hypothetical protein